jgi:hypothetical protein
MIKAWITKPFLLYLYYNKKHIMENSNLNGLSLRHVAQIVRRRMIQKAKPSGKVYSRKKYRSSNED